MMKTVDSITTPKRISIRKSQAKHTTMNHLVYQTEPAPPLCLGGYEPRIPAPSLDDNSRAPQNKDTPMTTTQAKTQPAPYRRIADHTTAILTQIITQLRIRWSRRLQLGQSCPRTCMVNQFCFVQRVEHSSRGIIVGITTRTRQRDNNAVIQTVGIDYPRLGSNYLAQLCPV